MREVWLVKFGSVYDGLEVVSAWGSEEDAKAEAARLEASENCMTHDMAEVCRLDVGAPHETPTN